MKKIFLSFLALTISNFANAATSNFSDYSKNIDLYNSDTKTSQVAEGYDFDSMQKEAIDTFLPELKRRFPNEDWAKIENLNQEDKFSFIKAFVAEKAFIETRDKFISEIRQKASEKNRIYIQESYSDHTSNFYAQENYALDQQHCFFTCTDENNTLVAEQPGKECKNRQEFCIDATPVPENFEKIYMTLQPSFEETEKGICKNNFENGMASINYTVDDYQNNTRTEYHVSLSCAFDTQNEVFQDSLFRFTETKSDLSNVRKWENQWKSDIRNGITEDTMLNDGQINPKWKSSKSPGGSTKGIIKDSSLTIR